MAAHPAISAPRKVGATADRAVDAVQADRAAAAHPPTTGRARDAVGTIQAEVPLAEVPATGKRSGSRAAILLSHPVQR